MSRPDLAVPMLAKTAGAIDLLAEAALAELASFVAGLEMPARRQ